MAKPTHQVYACPTPNSDRPHDLAQALGVQPEALREWGRLVQAFHDHGILTILVALVEQSPAIGALAVDQVARPDRIAALRNLIGLLTEISQMSPETLRRLQKGWQAASRTVSADQAPLGIWGLVRTLGDPDVNRGIRLVVEGLKRLGQLAPVD